MNYYKIPLTLITIISTFTIAQQTHAADFPFYAGISIGQTKVSIDNPFSDKGKTAGHTIVGRYPEQRVVIH